MVERESQDGDRVTVACVVLGTESALALGICAPSSSTGDHTLVVGCLLESGAWSWRLVSGEFGARVLFDEPHHVSTVSMILRRTSASSGRGSCTPSYGILIA